MPSTLPQPGATVWIRGQRWRVSAVRRDGHVTRLDVAGDAGRRAFLHPFDVPAPSRDRARPVRVRPQRARARLAWLAGTAFSGRTLLAAVSARVEILPHQLEPALAAIGGERRMLIADEVGLGKTIQAGLVAAELFRRDPFARVLVVVPAALTAQWADELRQRFDLACVTGDHHTFTRRAQDRAFGDNPWNGAGIFITSLDFLKQPHVLDGMPARAWDLVVIDEAHAACGHSDRHAAAHFASQRSRCVVLLTATPHSGDDERFARLLSIGELDGDKPIVFRRRRGDVGMPGTRRTTRHHVSLSPAELRVFTALGSFERVVIRAARPANRDEARLLVAVLTKRALSTARALSMSIGRRLAWLASAGIDEAADGWVQARLDLGGGEAEDVASEDDLLGLSARTGLDTETERSWLKRLAHLAGEAAGHESKVRRAIRLIARTDEPVIIFTEFRDSLTGLVNQLQLLRPVAVLHGGLTSAERSEAIGRFQGGDATILIATDVAGQGLNLQHRCRWVISLELPWNPMRLEQRIGRVDRIGQRRRTHFTLLLARHDREQALVAHLTTRIQTATRATMPMAGRKWTAWGRRAARQLELRRRLVARWRGPERPGRPITTHHAMTACAVFSVPLLDRTGAVVERHLAAVRIAGPVTRNLIAEAGRMAIARLQPRLRRVRRLKQASLARMTRTERAIADAIGSATDIDGQPGLFDATALRAFEAARASRNEGDRQLEAAIERLRLAADIEPGQPALEIIWLPRP